MWSLHRSPGSVIRPNKIILILILAVHRKIEDYVGCRCICVYKDTTLYIHPVCGFGLGLYSRMADARPAAKYSVYVSTAVIINPKLEMTFLS